MRSASRMVSGWCGIGLLVGATVMGCGQTADVQGDNGAGGGSESGGNGGHDGTGGLKLEPGSKNSGGTGAGSGSVDLDTLTIVYDGSGVLDVEEGEEPPSIQFSATVEGKAVAVGWSVDRGELGTIDEEGLFIPRGTVGGWVTIRAGLNDKVVDVRILIRVHSSQNGAAAADATQVAEDEAELTTGGGLGGVGGEGLGEAVSDQDLLDLLTAGATEDGSELNFELLYPYDGTVFPRGVLAPLIMWRWDPDDADAIRMDLETLSGSFRWTGTFGRPSLLADTGRSFIRHPIPQSVWERATQSAGERLDDGGSDTLHFSLTVVRDGTAYGPLTRTFAIAPGRLTGTVYYNSYGTGLAENFQHARGGQPNDFGAAVLAIRSGETAPTLVSGFDSSGDHSGCRACHTVSAQGSHLLVQGGGNDRRSWLRDLLEDEENYLVNQDSIFAWAGLSPDGSLALTNAVDVSKHNRTVDPDNYPHSLLWDMTTSPPSAVDAAGLPDELKAALPAFSPDGKQVAFAYLGGSGDGVPEDLETDGSKLVVMDFDPATRTFSNFRVVATGHANDAAEYRAHGAGWPSFVPGNTHVVFQNEVRGSKSNETYIGTRDEARGELWWARTDASEPPVRLDYLNGIDAQGASYLPVGPNKHGVGDGDYDDTTLSYEPTVAPVVAGGYAWVVFTSRRMYGNVATSDPWRSDPRTYDWKDYDNVTTKKLWVAALRLDAGPGEDPSFPAFYLPAQELVAGNARGYWVLDPCRDDGSSCESGDQCCGGYCQPSGPDGALICSATTTTVVCSQEQERCTTAEDCCSPTAQCTGGFCAVPPPRIIR